MAWDLDLYVEKRTAGGAWEPIEAPGEPDDTGLPRSWSERSGCEREAMHALARLGDVDGIGLAHAMADAPRGRPDGLSLELQLVSRRFERLAARSREEVFFSWVTLAEVDTFDFHQSTKMLCVADKPADAHQFWRSVYVPDPLPGQKRQWREIEVKLWEVCMQFLDVASLVRNATAAVDKNDVRLLLVFTRWQTADGR